MSQHDAPGVIMEEQQAPSGGAPKAAPKSRAVWIAVAVIVVIVVVVLAAVLGGLFAPAAPAHLRIGTLLSITGGLSLFGPGDTLGADLAVEEINAGGWFFRTISSDRLQGSVAASYLYTNSSFRYANVMVINNPYGNGLGAIFKTKFEAAGGKVNDTVVIEEAKPDYTSALTRLFQTNPEVVYFVAYPDTGLTVMKQWEQQRGSHSGAWDKQWVFSEGLQDQVFVNQLHATSVGVDVTKLWGTAPAAPVSSLYAEFVNKYKARFSNYVPVLYASHTYDAVWMIA